MRKGVAGTGRAVKGADREYEAVSAEHCDGYGYINVKEFLTEYKVSKAEYSDYKSAVVKWEQQIGNKVDDSFRAKLQQMQKRAKEEEQHRSNLCQRKSDREAR